MLKQSITLIATLAALGTTILVTDVNAQSLGATKSTAGQSSPRAPKFGFKACCAKVHNVCVSECNQPGGCSGQGDCDVTKNRNLGLKAN